MFEDLDTSLQQLPHNTACADGRLVTPITPPATGQLIAPKRFVGLRIRIARTQNRKSKCISSEKRLSLRSTQQTQIIAYRSALYAANSFSNAFASFRSRVSNPSVNHP
jgi:hypothetical protein